MAKKAKVTEGLQEDRTRVTLFLPVHKQDDIRAFRSVVAYLGKQRKARTCKVTGFTQSSFPDSSFRGIWWSGKQRRWVPERVVMVLIDYAAVLGDSKLHGALSRLKRAIQASYKRVNREQEVVWIIAQPAMRYA